MNLLIVDDEYLVVEEVVTVTDWELLGITEIYSATNAVSAVRILNEKKIDIMICDIEMPQTDGLELSKKAKENFPDLEIVMLTSHAEFNYVRNALRYGCYDYLLKPVMEDDIIKRASSGAVTGRRNCMEPVKTSMERKILGGNAQRTT